MLHSCLGEPTANPPHGKMREREEGGGGVGGVRGGTDRRQTEGGRGEVIRETDREKEIG